MDIKDLIKSLSEQDIINIMTELGAELIKGEDDKQLIFTSICHNSDSHKLYYYKDSQHFYCYSKCNAIGDIVSLVKKVLNCNTSEAIHKIMDITSTSKSIKGFHKRKIIKKVDLKDVKVELLPTPTKPFIYSIYEQIPIKSWEQEGISFKSIKKFNIYFNKIDNQIIIPHFGWDSEKRVVGIRVRNLNEFEIENYGKYTPFYYYGNNYAHKLGLNLYGYNFNKKYIYKTKKVIIFEGEKSVLQMDSMYKYSISVATCGSNLTKEQKKILLDSDVKEIIIAFDKQFKKNNDEESEIWKTKIKKITKDIKDIVKVTVIWDKNDVLDYKDSPSDKGKYVFEYLFKNRIDIDKL